MSCHRFAGSQAYEVTQRRELRVGRANIHHFFGIMDRQVDALESDLRAATREVQTIKGITDSLKQDLEQARKHNRSLENEYQAERAIMAEEIRQVRKENEVLVSGNNTVQRVLSRALLVEQGALKLVAEREEANEKVRVLVEQNAGLKEQVAKLECELVEERQKNAEGNDAAKKFALMKRKWSDLAEIMG